MEPTQQLPLCFLWTCVDFVPSGPVFLVLLWRSNTFLLHITTVGSRLRGNLTHDFCQQVPWSSARSSSLPFWLISTVHYFFAKKNLQQPFHSSYVLDSFLPHTVANESRCFLCCLGFFVAQWQETTLFFHTSYVYTQWHWCLRAVPAKYWSILY